MLHITQILAAYTITCIVTFNATSDLTLHACRIYTIVKTLLADEL